MNITNPYDIIHSRSFLINIVKKIETLVKHDLSDSEEDLVINCINKVPNHILNTSSIERIVNIITDTVISELHREHCMSNDIDTHEMLKKQIGKTIADKEKIIAATTKQDFVKKLSPIVSGQALALGTKTNSGVLIKGVELVDLKHKT